MVCVSLCVWWFRFLPNVILSLFSHRLAASTHTHIHTIFVYSIGKPHQFIFYSGSKIKIEKQNQNSIKSHRNHQVEMFSRLNAFRFWSIYWGLIDFGEPTMTKGFAMSNGTGTGITNLGWNRVGETKETAIKRIRALLREINRIEKGLSNWTFILWLSKNMFSPLFQYWCKLIRLNNTKSLIHCLSPWLATFIRPHI